MIKQVSMGERGGWVYRNMKTFFVLKIPEILIGWKVYNYSPLFLYKYDLYVTSA